MTGSATIAATAKHEVGNHRLDRIAVMVQRHGDQFGRIANATKHDAAELTLNRIGKNVTIPGRRGRPGTELAVRRRSSN
jgi:hypothetical protein